jgi:hypothetical protein
MGELYQCTRVAMGLKESGPYFQCSMSNTVIVGLVYQILPWLRGLVFFLQNVRKVFEGQREFNVAVNPAKKSSD